MLADFVDKLRSMMLVSMDPRVEKIADGRLAWRDAAGELQLTVAEVAPRSASLGSIGAVVDAADLLEGEAEVWVDTERVVVIDPERREHTFKLELGRSTQFEFLIGLGQNAVPMSQKAAIQALRFQLTGASSLVSSLRKIDFTRRSDGSASVEHGRETLGRSVEAKVQAAEELPQQFTVTVPCFSALGTRVLSQVDVEVGIEIDAGEATFRFCPLADEIEQAELVAARNVHADLRKTLKCPVLMGSPGVPL